MLVLRVLLTIAGLISVLLLRHHFSELANLSDLGDGRISGAKSFQFPLYFVSFLEMGGWMGLLFVRVAPKSAGNQLLSAVTGSLTFICTLILLILSAFALGYEDQAGGVPFQYELKSFYLLQVLCLTGLMVEGSLWFFDRQATNPRSAFFAPGQSR